MGGKETELPNPPCPIIEGESHAPNKIVCSLDVVVEHDLLDLDQEQRQLKLSTRASPHNEATGHTFQHGAI